MARPSSYEVQFYQLDHWVLDSRFDTEAEALGYGKRVLSRGKIEGIRVVRDWQRPDGRHVETEIHSEFRATSNAILISPIDEAPLLCRTAQHWYGLESRMVMNRLLRGYVERLVVTPTEILHNHAELKRLLDRDNLVPMAVGRVAALQAEKSGLDGRARRDELYGILNGLTERARDASSRKDLPAITGTGFGSAFGRLEQFGAPEDRDFLGRVVLSRELVQTRNWLAKLDFLGELVREDGGLAGQPLALVDGFIADVVGAPSVAQELLGGQGSLAEALCSLIDLSRGRLLLADREGDDPLLQLNELLAFHDLVETRRVLVELVRRQLRGTLPLHRADPTQEKDAYQRILQSVTTADGILGGGPMAEALVLRWMRFQEAGGAPGRRLAIDAVASRYADAKDRVRFLLALLDSEMGRQHQDDIAATLERMTGDPEEFSRFVLRDQPIKTNLEQFTTLFVQVAGSAAPDPLRSRLADQLDDLLVAYIVNSRVVERLDKADDPLRHRASRLVQLCTPGTLRSRKALDIVRQRVISHLRQPNFERKYVEDIPDPDGQQRALRDFHRLLQRAGFS